LEHKIEKADKIIQEKADRPLL